ncbi:MAG: peptide chain release factor N(5)-glutamine methyltransferase [Alphaproteobacteria bacterium]|nr:peptide chain release factor N(5)-glutamine methyltransferase [Alphaproteobacteria bacterium]
MANGNVAEPGLTLRQALAAAGQDLAAANIEDPKLDAALLLAHAVGGDRLTLIRDGERRLDPSEAEAFAGLIAARAARKPVSRLLGRREFWSLDLAIDEDVLDPRPDSETAVAAGLELLADVNGAYRIADFGTGSGCLLLALLVERPGAWGIGVDISLPAARIARRNAKGLDLSGRAHFITGNWGGALAPGFDLIVANPPYIPTADIAGLAPEVRCHDPALALDGGDDGMAAYRALAPDLKRLLNSSGQAVLECGHDQAAGLADVLVAAGLCFEGFDTDLAGRDRCVRVSRGL